MNLSAKHSIWAAAVGVAIVVASGVLYLFDSGRKATLPAVDHSGSFAASDRIGGSPTMTVPSMADIDRVARLIGEARRFAWDGEFDQADAALNKADAIIPGLTEIAQVRRDIAHMRTPQGQLALHLERARLAIARVDRTTAEKALGKAERINPQEPEIAKLRQAMDEAERTKAHRDRRIAELLGEMRQAIARGDLIAADRALDEAERLDIHNPAIDPARLELARAQDTDRKRQGRQ